MRQVYRILLPFADFGTTQPTGREINELAVRKGMPPVLLKSPRQYYHHEPDGVALSIEYDDGVKAARNFPMMPADGRNVSRETPPAKPPLL